MTENEGNHAEAQELKEEVKILEDEVELLEELIDLEEWAKAGKEPKKAKKYRLRIDTERKVVEVHEMTGRQILGLVDKTPEKYLLSEKVHGGGFKPVGADEVVIFHNHRIERFQTLALDPTDG